MIAEDAWGRSQKIAKLAILGALVFGSNSLIALVSASLLGC